jgi:hypothetical protein
MCARRKSLLGNPREFDIASAAIPDLRRCGARGWRPSRYLRATAPGAGGEPHLRVPVLQGTRRPRAFRIGRLPPGRRLRRPGPVSPARSRSGPLRTLVSGVRLRGGACALESGKEPVVYVPCVPRTCAVRGKDVLPEPGSGAMARWPEGVRRSAAWLRGPGGIAAPLASDGQAPAGAQARSRGARSLPVPRPRGVDTEAKWCP